MKVLTATILALALVFPASKAAAQTTHYEGGPPAILKVQVSATVNSRCGFTAAPTGAHHEPDFDAKTWSADFPLLLDCTGPSRVAVVSQNGGLVTAAPAASGYSNKAKYSVTLNLVGNGSITANANCEAETLINGASCAFLGPASTSKGLILSVASILQTGSYLRVSGTPQAGLIAGSYSDILTVTLSPAA